MTAASSRQKQPQEARATPSARQVVLALAVSLDMYIARKDGAVDWLIMDPEIDMRAYTKNFDVIVAGRKTLDFPDDKIESKSGRSPWGRMECYVFSRTKPAGKCGGVAYLNESPSALLGRIRERPGKDIWLMGGGELAREFLKEDLVDRMDLGIMPVLLGEGIPLFPQGFPQRNFALEQIQTYKSGIVRASYARKCVQPREKN